MDVEVIAIGNEILAGFTINSNATFISAELLQAGYQVGHHQVVADDAQAIQDAIMQAMSRSAVVICTGGLGPTCDDTTRQVVADLFGSRFHFDEEVAKDLRARFGEELATLEDQATVPTKALAWKNTVGTAPGFVFSGKEKEAKVILVPGVPMEMRAMVRKNVIPYLQENLEPEKRSCRKVITFCQLIESQVDPFLRELKELYPKVNFGIYPGLGLLTVHVMAEMASLLEGPVHDLCERFSRYVFEAPSGKIEEAVHDLFVEKGWTLSVAESCTGGNVSAAITSVPGASKMFLGSVISYANFVKQQVLGVSDATLRDHGAVSEETIREMAWGVMSLTGSDFSIAVSGVAGPEGGTPEKPVGTVWVAVARKGGDVCTRLLKLRGNRATIVHYAANLALSELWQLARGIV